MRRGRTRRSASGQRLPGTSSGRLERQVFGIAEGREVALFTLVSEAGVRARVTERGASLVALEVADLEGRLEDVVLGYDTLEGYLADRVHMGAVVGRYANRIANGRFELDGWTYELATNNGPNHLHGGVRGFGRVLWSGREVETADGVAVELSYASPDGEEGYPGNLEATVTYTLLREGALVISTRATTDRPTVVNLSLHNYFNLAGAGSGDILGHELEIAADHYTPVSATLIPTGEIASVAGTPFDFRTATPIGARIDDPHEQLARGQGYDHNFVLRPGEGGPRLAARVVEPGSGRTLELETTTPALQLYTGNYLDDLLVGKGGRSYPRRSGFCLEPQFFPDSPNRPAFPSPVLRPGETWEQTTVYRLALG